MKNKSNDKNHDKNRRRDKGSLRFDVGSPALQSLLPYYAYDPEQDIFINQSSVGFGIELTLLTGANEQIVEQWHRIIAVLPDKANWFGQFIRYQHNKVGNRLKQNADSLVLPHVFQDRSHKYYQYAAIEGFPNLLNASLKLLDHRLFFFVSVQADKDLSKKMTELMKVRDRFENELVGNSVGFIRVTDQLFMNFLRQIMNYDHQDIYSTDEAIDPINPLSHQIAQPNLEWAVEEDQINYRFDRTQKNSAKSSFSATGSLTALSFHRIPEQFALWQSADNFMNIEKPASAIACPFLFSVTFCFKSQFEAKRIAQQKLQSKQKFLGTPMAKLLPNLKQAAAEWELVKTALDNDECRYASTQVSLILITQNNKDNKDNKDNKKNKNKEENERECEIASAKNAFAQNGFELCVKRYLQLPLVLSALPFMMPEGLWQDLKPFTEIHRRTSYNIVNLIPLMSDFKGPDTGVLMSSFRNQLTAFNVFSQQYPTDNMNIAITAASGSGKSFLTQQLVLDVLGRGGRAWIIDRGESYKKFARLYGGTYLTAQSISLNPFTFVEDIQQGAEPIRDFFAVLASPHEDLTPVQRAYLNTAVIEAFKKKNNQATVNDLISALQAINAEKNNDKKDSRIEDMIVLLTPYTLEGQYGNYFNFKSELDPNAALTVLELGDFQKSLLRPVLFALFVLINEQMYLTQRNVPKMCVIDEAWALLDGENRQAKEFINTGFRTARKHGGSFCSITQGIGDYFRSSEAKAAWDNSAVKVILRQGDGFKSDVKLCEGFLSAFEEKMIGQFAPTRASGFASMLIKTGSYSSFNRFFVDPFTRIAFSTDGEEFQQVEQLEKEGLSIEAAIQVVAERKYGRELLAIQSIKAGAK